VSALSGRHFVMQFRFDGLYDIQKFGGILDKEHWNVVVENVPVVFVGVGLGRKTANIANGVLQNTHIIIIITDPEVVFDGSVKTQNGGRYIL
jgi:hypothetical protein